MQQNDLPVTDDASAQVLSVEIDRFAEQAVTRFAHVGAQLRDVHKSLTNLTKQLDTLADLVADDDAGPEPLEVANTAILVLLKRLEEWEGVATATASTRALRIARRSLDAIAANALSLSAIASMTAVTSGSVGVVNLKAYITKLKGMATDLDGRATVVEERRVEIVRARKRALTGISQALRLLRRSAGDLAATSRDRIEAVVAERAARAAIKSLAGDVKLAVRSDIRILVTAMQFSDSFAQRMDHLAAILRHAGQLDDADPLFRVLQGLTFAQCEAATQDAASVCADAQAALRRIVANGRRGKSIFEQDMSDNSADKLSKARESALNDAILPLAMVGPAVSAACAESDRVKDAVERAAAEFTQLRQIFMAITLSAINATLLTGRSGPARAPLGVLAAAVQERERACGIEMEECQKSLALLAAAQDDARISDVHEATQAFSKTVDVCMTQLQKSQTGVAALGGLRSQVTENVQVLIRTTHASTSEIAGIVSITSDILSRLSMIQAGQIEDCERFANHRVILEIFDSYSMQRERDVHVAFMGATEAPHLLKAS